jgi:ABC-type nickel/cobalt efflux system permease component RcnA
MAGGVIPCWDAIAVLGATIGLKETPLVLPAVLVFSAGLAAVLVAIGVLVVHVPRFVESRFGNGRLLRALPIISAILVTLMGIWMCYEGVHGQ